MKYEDLSHNDFDAIVTGELTQYAINLEGELIDIITEYLKSPENKKITRTTLCSSQLVLIGRQRCRSRF